MISWSKITYSFSVNQNILWLTIDQMKGVKGKLSLPPKQNVLTEVKNFPISHVGKYNCIYVIYLHSIETNAILPNKMLPITIPQSSNQERILIEPSKILYFNR